MAFQAADPDFEARVRASFGRQAAMKLIGAVLTRVEPGIATIELPYRADLGQQHGFFHGGMVAMIADSAAGYAAYTLFPADSSVLTVEFKLNLDRAGRRRTAGRDRAGKEDRGGRSRSASSRSSRTRAGSATVCALGLETLICLAGRPDAPAG